MNLENIETFLTIVKTENISKTAETLFLSQSTISHRLKSLEVELGTKLIQRNRGEKKITLTLEGEEFINLANKWLILEKETIDWKMRNKKLKIKVGCSDSLNTCVFPKLYQKLLKSDSSLVIKVHSHWSRVILNSIDNYDLDLGLVLIPNSNRNLLFEPLFTERLVVISYPDKSLGDIVSPRELAQADELYFYNGPDFKIWHDYWWDPSLRNLSTVDTISLLQSVFDSKNYWSIVPISAAKSIAKYKHIKISELSEPAPEKTCYKVKHRYPKQTAIRSIDIFESELKRFIESDYLKKFIT